MRKQLSPGFQEVLYKRALALELQARGLKAELEHPISVFYKGVNIGDYFADILVENSIILEVKAVSELVAAHEVQLVNYLTATGKDFGILINYGGEKFAFRKKTRLYRPQKG